MGGRERRLWTSVGTRTVAATLPCDALGEQIPAKRTRDRRNRMEEGLTSVGRRSRPRCGRYAIRVVVVERLDADRAGGDDAAFVPVGAIVVVVECAGVGGRHLPRDPVQAGKAPTAGRRGLGGREDSVLEEDGGSSAASV